MSNQAAIPTPFKDIAGDNRWLSMHKRFVNDCKRYEPNVIFIGDSLIQQMQHTSIWRESIEPLHCLNFGIGDDKTQNVLWRIQNGELEFENNHNPKIVVLLIGTNNYEHSAEQISDAILKIVIEIRKKLAKTYIIILAIPPRGHEINNLREKIVKINNLVEKNLQSITFNDKNITFLCHSKVYEFINPQDGTISHTDMFDYLHFTDQGLRKYLEPVLDEINEILAKYNN